MDVDCDGIDWQCPYDPFSGMTLTDSGNTDGQPQTNWGNLSAYQVPYIVVPDSAFQKLHIPQNAISVVICGGQMFYAIMGDTNGNDPQVIGEASWLLGQTCFPDEGLSGSNDHETTDVLCISPLKMIINLDIVFKTEVTGVNNTHITDYDGLRELGDQKMGDLIQALNATKSAAPSGPGGGKNCVSHMSISLIFFSILSTIIINI